MQILLLALLMALLSPTSAEAGQEGDVAASDTLKALRADSGAHISNIVGLGASLGTPLLDRGSEIRVTAPRSFLGTRTGTAVSLEGDLLVFTPSDYSPPFLEVVLDPTVELYVRREPRWTAVEVAVGGLALGAVVGSVMGYFGPEECIGSQPCSLPARTFVGGVRTGILAGAVGYIIGETILRPRWIRILERNE
ncbi:MAG: hypothetical protein WEA09_00320 [Gemmatimonadota bacterium]